MALNEGRYTGEFLLSEAPGTLSRDAAVVTVPASTTLAPGTVLGKIAVSGKYAPYDDANSDGTEVAAAILVGEAANAALAPADLDAAIVNLNAEVRADDLVWGSGVDEDAGTADLLGIGIKARS